MFFVECFQSLISRSHLLSATQQIVAFNTKQMYLCKCISILTPVCAVGLCLCVLYKIRVLARKPVM